MGTTDFTDDTDETDEEQRRISGERFIPPFRHSAIPPLGRMQSHGADSKQADSKQFDILDQLFISGISVIRGRSPLFLVAAE